MKGKYSYNIHYVNMYSRLKTKLEITYNKSFPNMDLKKKEQVQIYIMFNSFVLLIISFTISKKMNGFLH